MAIVSFRHNFAFVKTMKTAGTSIEVELAKRVEDGAIVTPVRPRERGHHPRNYKSGGQEFYNHMPAVEIKRQLGADRYHQLYVFCVERDPIGKCVSHFNMLKRLPPFLFKASTKRLSFAEYCERGVFPIDIDKYTEVTDGVRRRIVARVIAYERLQEQMDEVAIGVGLGPIPLTARAKTRQRPTKGAVTKDQVTSDQRALILGAFAESLHYAGLEEFYAR